MWFSALLGFILGAVLGSFFTAAADRFQRHKNLGGRSRCPVCGRSIAWRLNIPILSYLWLRGHAKCCKARIPLSYLALEAGGACIFAFVGWFGGIVIIWIFFVGAIITTLIAVSWRSRHAKEAP